MPAAPRAKKAAGKADPAAATTRPSASKAKALVEPADFDRVTGWLTRHVLVERDLEMRILVRGTLAGVNVHMIGEPGVAKSLSLREFARSIVGARYFEKQVHGLMPADALIGAYDPKKFLDSGELVRNTVGKLPEAHIGFIDEIPRANGPTLDALLSLMNTQERQYEHNGVLHISDLRVAVTASNTWFDPENQQAQALSDRVTLMLMINDIQSDDSFKELIRRNHERRMGATSIPARETITLEQLDDAQRQVKEVIPSPDFLDAMAKLRREAKAEGLRISPRRWEELTLVCRANAWMSGRDETVREDLAIVQHGLWRDKDDIATATKLVMEFQGRFERAAQEKRQEAAKALASVEEIRPEVESTPAEQELDQGVLTKAISASRQIDQVQSRVQEVLKEADKEKRDAAALRELSNELLATQQWFEANGLPTSYKGPADSK